MGSTHNHSSRVSISEKVRHRIESGSNRIWQFTDFEDLPTQAVAKTLSRLSHSGELRRLSKGVYYRSRMTTFGESHPNPTHLHRLAVRRYPMFPSGVAAASLLGFTTQNAAQKELATTAESVPRKLLGDNVVLHTRRPHAWKKLQPEDAALLDFLRNRAKLSELSPQDTVMRLLALLKEPGQFQRLLCVAETEPPRVRAMLGALGEQLKECQKSLSTLRRSLNPLSRFDFGMLSVLPNAQQWQAKVARKS